MTERRRPPNKKNVQKNIYERFEARIEHDTAEDKRVKEFWDKVKKARENEQKKQNELK